MLDLLKNFAYSTVATAPSPATTGTSLVVASGGGALFPAPPFNAVVWPANQSPLSTNTEIVRVTAIFTDTLTITREQEDTTARTIVTGDQIMAAVTKKTLEDRATPFYTVGESDAQYITDGTADDVQIQQALDDADAAGGGIVHIKAGLYDITSALAVGDYTTIEGDGFSTILKHTAGTGFNGLIKNNDQVSGNTRIIIRELAIDGNKANVTGSDPRDTIYFKLVTKSIIENCYLVDGADSAIVLDQSATTNNLISGNIIDGCVDIGIYISVANQNTIIGNQVHNTGSYGIRNVNSGAVRNVITNNYVYNCGQTSGADGIICSNGDGSTISNNVVYGSGQYGIQNTSPYVTITGNNVINSDQHGIYLSGAMRCEVSGNVCHANGTTASNTYSGIYLNNASEVTLVGNRSGDTGSGTRQKYGIEEVGTSDTNVIIGNMVERNGTAGVNVIGASTQVFGNSKSSSTISKALTITSADASNETPLTIVQNDSTNDGKALVITSAANGGTNNAFDLTTLNGYAAKFNGGDVYIKSGAISPYSSNGGGLVLEPYDGITGGGSDTLPYARIIFNPEKATLSGSDMGDVILSAHKYHTSGALHEHFSIYTTNAAGTPLKRLDLDYLQDLALMTFSNTNVTISGAITDASANSFGLKANPTFDGAGAGAAGLRAEPTHTPSASVSAAYGFINLATFNPGVGVTITNAYAGYNRFGTSSGAGAVTSGYGQMIATPSFGTLKPSTMYGIRIQNHGSTGVTNAYGAYIELQSGATNNYALYLVDSTGVPAGGIHFTTDTNLYRNAANSLKTDDSLSVALNLSMGKTASFTSEIDDGNSGTADTIDWTTGNKHKSTVTGAVTYTFTAPAGVCNLQLKLVNGGSQTITWPATVMWSGGVEPSLTVSGTDLINFYWDGENYYGAAGLAFA